ncbi:hypothetical protein ACOMHN_056460 [Nucella lapillus]
MDEEEKDFSMDEEEKDNLSFYFSSDENFQSSGFRLRYSFHKSDLKPERVNGFEARQNRRLPDVLYYPMSTDGPKWNCSVSVWHDLLEHFPCDLISQCAESEDEARCPYKSEKCGDNKIEAGRKCYIYERQHYLSWFDSNRRCQQHGAILASLETTQELKDVTEVLEYLLTDDSIWIGLKTARKSITDTHLNAM